MTRKPTSCGSKPYSRISARAACASSGSAAAPGARAGPAGPGYRPAAAGAGLSSCPAVRLGPRRPRVRAGLGAARRLGRGRRGRLRLRRGGRRGRRRVGPRAGRQQQGRGADQPRAGVRGAESGRYRRCPVMSSACHVGARSGTGERGHFDFIARLPDPFARFAQARSARWAKACDLAREFCSIFQRDRARLGRLKHRDEPDSVHRRRRRPAGQRAVRRSRADRARARLHLPRQAGRQREPVRPEPEGAGSDPGRRRRQLELSRTPPPSPCARRSRGTGTSRSTACWSARGSTNCWATWCA